MCFKFQFEKNCNNLLKMVRTYRKDEILTVYKFPSFTYEEKDRDGISRTLTCEWIIHRPEIGAYCVVIRNAIPKWMTSQLFLECQRDCVLQLKNTVFNNTYLQPRLNCVYSDPKITKQKYSNTEVPTIPWTSLMNDLRNYVARDGFNPNAALVNGYINPDHRVDYHRDRELRDGRDIVATVSLGGSRVFSFIEISNEQLSPPIWLHDGDLVFFYDNTNTHYKHSIIKPLHGTDSRPRYSVTFRVIDIQ